MTCCERAQHGKAHSTQYTGTVGSVKGWGIKRLGCQFFKLCTKATAQSNMLMYSSDPSIMAIKRKNKILIRGEIPPTDIMMSTVTLLKQAKGKGDSFSGDA